MDEKVNIRPGGGVEARLVEMDARGLRPIVRLRKAVIDAIVARRNRRAEETLRAMPALWARMEAYAKGSAVTGASMSDYLTLYEEVRKWRPREILECGTGISTVVMAQALLENEAEGHPRGRITSMEEDEAWHRSAGANLPDGLRPYVDLVFSPKVDGFYKMFRGVQYEAVPDRPYNFVFSDGPERHSPVNGDKLFNLDLIQVVRRSETPVRAVVDNHYLTFYVLQKVFGPRLARYSVRHKLMFVGPVTAKDVGRPKRETFLPDLRLFAATELKLRMARDD
ncbi:MAG: class I SAM-dependent methyltransferase [Rhodospirillales bacterium]